MQALDLDFPLLSDWNAEATHGFGVAYEHNGMRDVSAAQRVPRRRRRRRPRRLGLRAERAARPRRADRGRARLVTVRRSRLLAPWIRLPSPSRAARTAARPRWITVGIAAAVVAVVALVFVSEHDRGHHALVRRLQVDPRHRRRLLGRRRPPAHRARACGPSARASPEELMTIARQAAFAARSYSHLRVSSCWRWGSRW